ncbi:hypothetical protein GHT07_07375 [Caenimonas koreensis DSM 17982]|uniref:Uncharacterized protein n=1 Tax=Caenimonas koreensis DSM 17982 TaxID=1121255 RepID=A0A844ASM0_9BURK|nr:hypothetical protein [Caenimonas koreensis]MRD47094.1 hypothetical protein [Caenimonas koreensis DSM 17982]
MAAVSPVTVSFHFNPEQVGAAFEPKGAAKGDQPIQKLAADASKPGTPDRAERLGDLSNAALLHTVDELDRGNNPVLFTAGLGLGAKMPPEGPNGDGHSHKVSSHIESRGGDPSLMQPDRPITTGELLAASAKLKNIEVHPFAIDLYEGIDEQRKKFEDISQLALDTGRHVAVWMQTGEGAAQQRRLVVVEPQDDGQVRFIARRPESDSPEGEQASDALEMTLRAIAHRDSCRVSIQSKHDTGGELDYQLLQALDANAGDVRGASGVIREQLDDWAEGMTPATRGAVGQVVRANLLDATAGVKSVTIHLPPSAPQFAVEVAIPPVEMHAAAQSAAPIAAIPATPGSQKPAQLSPVSAGLRRNLQLATTPDGKVVSAFAKMAAVYNEDRYIRDCKRENQLPNEQRVRAAVAGRKALPAADGAFLEAAIGAETAFERMQGSVLFRDLPASHPLQTTKGILNKVGGRACATQVTTRPHMQLETCVAHLSKLQATQAHIARVNATDPGALAISRQTLAQDISAAKTRMDAATAAMQAAPGNLELGKQFEEANLRYQSLSRQDRESDVAWLTQEANKILRLLSNGLAEIANTRQNLLTSIDAALVELNRVATLRPSVTDRFRGAGRDVATAKREAQELIATLKKFRDDCVASTMYTELANVCKRTTSSPELAPEIVRGLLSSNV